MPRLTVTYQWGIKPSGRIFERRRRSPSRRKLNDEREEDATPISRLLTPCVAPSFLKDQEWIEPALHDWFHISGPQIFSRLELNKLGFGPERTRDWYRFVAMCDPLIYCIQARAAAYNTLRQLDPPSTAYRCNFLWLHGQTIEQLNLAISDPIRRLDSLTILAVLVLANHEVSSGGIENARGAHIPALRRMLEMRGGEERFMEALPECIRKLSRFLGHGLARSCGELVPIFSSPALVAVDDGSGEASNGTKRIW